MQCLKDKKDDIEFADDAALPTDDTITASERLTNLQAKADEEAGMKISIPKTKAQHIMPTPTVSETTEDDVNALPIEKQLTAICDKCGYTFGNKPAWQYTRVDTAKSAKQTGSRTEKEQ